MKKESLKSKIISNVLICLTVLSFIALVGSMGNIDIPIRHQVSHCLISLMLMIAFIVLYIVLEKKGIIEPTKDIQDQL